MFFLAKEKFYFSETVTLFPKSLFQTFFFVHFEIQITVCAYEAMLNSIDPLKAESEMYRANIGKGKMDLDGMKQQNQAFVEFQNSIVQHLSAQLNDAKEKLRQFVCQIFNFICCCLISS